MSDDTDLQRMHMYKGAVVQRGVEMQEDFLSYEGGYMPARIYYREKQRGKGHTQIWMDYGRKYSDDIAAQRAREQTAWPKITSMGELAEYILGSDLVTPEEARAIREKKAVCKNVGEYIGLFPDWTHALLRMRYLYDKRNEAHEEKEMQSLAKIEEMEK